MIEKIGHIKNPLTIVALFSGISEISGTVVLPFINEANQERYISFLILFPTFLVAVFFYTLWNKPEVLYSPSDWKDEKNWLRMIRPATHEEIERKVESEIAEAESEPDAAATAPTNQTDSPQIPTDPAVTVTSALRHSYRNRDVMVLYKIGEDRAFDVLSSEFPNLSRNVAINVANTRAVFDGVSTTQNLMTVFEVKVPKHPSHMFIHKQASDLASKVSTVSNFVGTPIRPILVVVLTGPSTISTQLLPLAVPIGNTIVEVRYIPFPEMVMPDK